MCCSMHTTMMHVANGYQHQLSNISVQSNRPGDHQLERTQAGTPSAELAARFTPKSKGPGGLKTQSNKVSPRHTHHVHGKLLVTPSPSPLCCCCCCCCSQPHVVGAPARVVYVGGRGFADRPLVPHLVRPTPAGVAQAHRHKTTLLGYDNVSYVTTSSCLFTSLKP